MQLISGFSNLIRSAVIRPIAYVAVVSLCLSVSPGLAQSLFSPAIKVNQDIVTWYELEQRQQFLTVLGAPGASDAEVRQALIDDRLRKQAMSAAGISASPEAVQLGIDEFAARGRLSTDEFLQLLSEAGVSRETVRDFVADQLSWRDFISARFLSQARPSEDEVNRALGQSGSGGLQVLLSEVIIPVNQQTVAQVELLAEEIALLEGFDAFSAAATQYSAAGTRTNGGQLDWLNLTDLPPALQPVIIGLKNGEITQPISLPNAVALFQLRGLREVASGTPTYSKIDYAIYNLPGGRSAETLARAADLREEIDTCDDLYGLAKDQPENVLQRIEASPSEIPRDVALELSKLDLNEVSTALTGNNGQTLKFLMLCTRTLDRGEETSRADVANALTQQRLTAFAESLLEQLRADATIIEQ
ncbi:MULTISPECIES: peptidylprolyl isomerase [unclassified Ruegeria]|uniref:peptidylprolyl isomerase n=1 Tax=unclassified Ruegeria TaxID=2625375 RepID=UPI001ADA8C5F|nr:MULTISPECIES: peptidylprolyl isomerase [unclassified Ruegeria]MBO9410514.1 peptidylprolyl isomerase [Ruegeria sp. R8_1]MBO9414267.1 peptidylprolyl isomerase [Ruegeria sp. R8_2]